MLEKTRFSASCPTILVFDSGVGGLSIYNEIQKLLPNLHYIYTFDNVAFPYGEKSNKFIVERVVEIVTAVQHYYSLKLAVIACNTASTISLPELRKKFQFPIVGVVPAIKSAACLTNNGIVGLLATCGTLKSSYVHRLIKRFASKCQIKMLSSTELVEMAEAKLHGEAVPLESLFKILQPWLQTSEPPDTVVLGCTHFPLLQDEFLSVLPKGTKLIDSGLSVAHRIVHLLKYEIPNIKSMETNIAYYTAPTLKMEKLLPVLRRCGFEVLEKLTF